MTIEEVEKLADSGDSGAMRSLGDYYFFDKKEWKNASLWYEKAVRNGNLESAYLAMNARANCAISGEMAATKPDHWRIILESWALCAQWARLVLSNGYFLQKAKDVAADHIEQSQYGKALCYMNLNDFKNAKEEASKCHSTEAKAMYGVCLLRLGDEKEFPTAHRCFSEVLKDSKYITSDKDLPEEKIYVGVLLGISMIYSLGIAGYINSNPALGYKILVDGRETVKNRNCRTAIDNELTCYKKTLFGGYKYVQ